MLRDVLDATAGQDAKASHDGWTFRDRKNPGERSDCCSKERVAPGCGPTLPLKYSASVTSTSQTRFMPCKLKTKRYWLPPLALHRTDGHGHAEDAKPRRNIVSVHQLQLLHDICCPASECIPKVVFEFDSVGGPISVGKERFAVQLRFYILARYLIASTRISMCTHLGTRGRILWDCPSRRRPAPTLVQRETASSCTSWTTSTSPRCSIRKILAK